MSDTAGVKHLGAAVLLAGVLVTIAGCGSGARTDYSAGDIREAFREIGLTSRVVFAPSTVSTASGSGELLKALAAASNEHLVAVVVAPRSAARGDGMSASVFDSVHAATASLAREGVMRGCGQVVGRRGNVVIGGDARYLRPARSALEHLPKRRSLPILRLKVDCATP